MPAVKPLSGAIVAIGYAFCASSTAEVIDINHTRLAPKIDGVMESIWQQGPWWPLDKHILGEIPSAEDFSGRFKLLWDKSKLYLLAEITDDVLIDYYADPKVRYWDDDCLEIFIDSDASGGNHLYSHNAFAYHVALDNQAADIGAYKGDGPESVVMLNSHLQSRWQRSAQSPHKIIWEVALNLYPDKYTDDTPLPPMTLEEDQEIGFMLAYCDADAGGEREHFMGSTTIVPVKGDKNLGYITADVFGKYRLSLSTPNQRLLR